MFDLQTDFELTGVCGLRGYGCSCEAMDPLGVTIIWLFPPQGPWLNMLARDSIY